MLFNYLGNKPLNLTLDSGLSFYVYPKQKGVTMSSQDWHFSKHLKPHKRLFVVVDDEDRDEHQPKKKAIKRKDLVLEPAQPEFEKQPAWTIDDRTKEVTAAGEMTKEEKRNKIFKKHTKIKRTKRKKKTL